MDLKLQRQVFDLSVPAHVRSIGYRSAGFPESRISFPEKQSFIADRTFLEISPLAWAIFQA